MNSTVTPPPQVFVVGCGDIGLRVARLWLAQPVPVTGLLRSTARAETLGQAGLDVVLADLDDPASLHGLPTAGALVYYFAPPPAQGRDDPRMRHFLAALPASGLPLRMVYISTSGVYGDQQGEVVTETTPANPQVDRARRRYDAEQQLRAFSAAHSVPVVILRVGGIYGPGRLPVERIRQGIPMVHEHLAPRTNRIHAEDLARLCVAAALRGRPGTVYNISDGTHSNMTEYFNTVADYLGLPRPPAIDWATAEQTLSPGMLSYLRESRCMDNIRMREELGVELLYPNLQAGLEATCGADRDAARQAS